MIPYGKQDVTDGDIEAVIQVLKSDFLTQGPLVPQFETAIAKYCGAQHGVAVNSATSALHIACLALELGPGDLLWTSPITFVASANCGRYCGADVDFVDIDPQTLNMCPQALERKLAESKETGRLPKVIVPVHMSGLPCQMEAIHSLASAYGIKIIEDASHAIGGRFGRRSVGACEYSDITVFSFHPVKIITTAEGGLATTNDEGLAQAMQRRRSHGITRDTSQFVGNSDGTWYYQQLDLGMNYRMSEMHAALGLSQLGRLDSYVARRHAIADLYDELLADLPIDLPTRPDGSYSALHLYIVRLRNAGLRSEVFEKLRAAQIGVNVHYIPVHTQPYYRKHGHAESVFPAAEDYYTRAISLPMFPTMTSEEQSFVASTFRASLKQ